MGEMLCVVMALTSISNFLSMVAGSGLTGYVDFKFISLPLAIVCIDCTIVRVIEPQRLLVVLGNGILKSVFNLT